MARWKNWSGSVAATPAALLTPDSQGALGRLIRTAAAPIRVAGSGHSFTSLVDTTGTVVSLDKIQGLISVDKGKHQATVWAGTKIWALGPALYAQGLGLKNQGDIDRQSIGGATGTGTHGTGVTLGSLSAEVIGATVVTPEGDIVECDANTDADLYQAARLSLGSLGVVSQLKLNVAPAYKLREKNYLLDAEEGLASLKQRREAHRHFEFFWFPYTNKLVCKELDPSDEAAPAPRAVEAMYSRGEKRSRDERLFLLGCRAIMRRPGLAPWLQRVFTRNMAASTRVRWSHEIFPSARTVRFNEMEYAVPADQGADCAREIVALIRRKKIPTGFPIEFRYVRADDVWLSPFYQRDSVTISIHQYARQDWRPMFDACEAIFMRYGGRPHWGKLHSLTAREFEWLYPRWGDFQRIRERADPKGRCLNPYLQTVFGSARGERRAAE